VTAAKQRQIAQVDDYDEDARVGIVTRAGQTAGAAYRRGGKKSRD